MHTDLTHQVLQNRYELLQEIGQGAQGKTFLAHDRQTTQPVAIKELQMDHVQEWQAIDLFEREANVLKTISHPAIPKFIDAFHTQADDHHGMRSFIVQEFIDGENLKQLLEDGLLVDESTARAFLTEMLNILEHLRTLPQPIIHADIKLSNIIRRRDQRLALIDFGAVQFHVTDDELPENSRPTIVGTAGYMPLEQMMGKAVPATDIYALAATTVHLLSRRHPADLPVIGMAMQFQDFVNISDPLTQILQKMLAPHLEDRFTSAAEVLRALHNSIQTNPAPIQFGKDVNEQQQFFNSWNVKTPTDSISLIELDTPRPQTLRAVFDNSDGQFHLTIPPDRAPIYLVIYAVFILFFVFGILGFHLVITEFATLTVSKIALYIPLSILFTFIPPWLGLEMFNNILDKHTLEIDGTNLLHHKKSFFRSKTTSIPLEAITAVKISDAFTVERKATDVENYKAPAIEIRYHDKTLLLGTHLPKDEQIYLVAEIRKKVFESPKSLES